MSGVALDVLLARRLQGGDEGGHVRRALARFPVPAVVHRVLDQYFVAGGVPVGQPFRPVPRLALKARYALGSC
ncbi:hypothetical protein GCM10009682_03530 [Luedemannella flava]|uniref:Uncharacterized protein n=1 Tax=Luedemannella flava TaxID=349316 RepID=A0ABP4XJ61_9ACTN